MPSAARVLSSVRARLIVMTVACAIVGGLAAADVQPPAPAPVAARTVPRAPTYETSDATRAAVDSSTTTIATHAAEATPAVHSFPVTATSPTDLPVAALDAYERSEQVIDSVRQGCHLSWSVLAAIGQVESDHGRSGGGDLRIDGTSSEPIRGAVLDGSGSTARVADTDGGLLDGNSTWDRAVGPMQFLPATWINVRVDGDGDGTRSPDDIDDASLAAGVFLCAWGDDLSTESGAAKAVGHFNRSRGYVHAVLTLARTYGSSSYLTYRWTDVLATWSGVPATTTASAAAQAASGSMQGETPHAHAAVTTSGSTANPTKNSPVAAPTSAPSPTGSPAVSPSAPETAPATGEPNGTETPGPALGSSPTPDPTPSPSPTPDPTPSAPPDDAGLSTLSGTLSPCGTQGFCVDGQAPDFGALDTPARSDLDGDGTVGTKGTELSGLVGTHVTVAVAGGAPGAVLTVNGLDW